MGGLRGLRRGLLVGLAATLLAACGGTAGGQSAGGTPTLNWYIFHDVSGSFPADAAACSAASNGEYNIRIQELPAAADGQRQQLRLWFDPSKLHLFNPDNGAHLTL